MARTGQCHCGAVRYTVAGDPIYTALCHCSDCRRWSGAPMASWIAFTADKLQVSGVTTTYESSDHGRREFCPACGTSLFYRNEDMLPGLVDIPSGTLDDPGADAPLLHVQVAERLPWMDEIESLPKFAAYPEGPPASD